MRENIRRNKKIKYGVLSLILMVMILSGLITNKIVNIDNYKGKIETNKVEVRKIKEENKKEITNTKKEDKKEEVKNENIVDSYEVINYKVKYTLTSDKNVKGREAIIKATLSEEERKYARFISIQDENISSEINNDGKEIEIRVKNVETNKAQELILKIEIDGAPSGFRISPIVSVKESTEKKDKKTVGEETVVESVSISGIVTDKEGNIKSGVELTLCKIEADLCIDKKVTYSKNDGSYTFSGLEEGRYKVTSDKENEYVLTSEIETEAGKGNTIVDLEVEENEGFKANIRKYIKEVRIEENGKEKIYDYENVKRASIAVKDIRNAKVRVIYSLKVKNVGKEDGYVKVVKEDIPEGLKYDKEYELNKNWEEENGILYNKSLSKEKLRVNEEKELEVGLILEDNDEAQNYINEVSITGEEYYKVKYIVNDKIVREEEILDSDKIDEYSYTEEGYDFKGWYEDKEFTKEYDFTKRIQKDTIIYGKVEQNSQIEKYNVIYMVDNTVYQSFEQIKGSIIQKTTKPNPSKEGYNFNGWVKEEENEIYDFNTREDKIENENVIFNASFSKKEYQVEYYIVDENLSTDENIVYKYYDSDTVKYNEVINLKEIPEREYYTAKYWSEDKINQYPNEAETTREDDEVIKLYAVYELNMCKLTLIIDSEVNTYDIGSNELAQNYFDESNEKLGYTYKYYAYDEEGNTKYTNILPAGALTNCNITLYKIYEPNKYEITLNNKNAETTGTEKLYERYNTGIYFDNEEQNEYVDKIELPTKIGYTFKGYYDGEKRLIDEEGRKEVIFTNTYFTNNETLDAKWEKNKYQIEYRSLEEDILNDGNTQAEYGDIISNYEPLNVPEIEGYTFSGNWSKEKNSEEIFDLTTLVTENVVLYPIYTINTYEISYDGNGSTDGRMENSHYTYNEEKALNKNMYEKEGYTFKGWSKTENGNVEYIDEEVVKNLTAENNKTVVLYAKWKANTYEIKYNGNGNTSGEMENSHHTYNEEKALNKNMYEKEGYTFKGWSKTENGEVKYTDEQIVKNITKTNNDEVNLYAVWEINNYKVTFKDTLNNNYEEEKTVPYNTSLGENNKELPSVSHKGYTFDGWYTERENGNIFDGNTKVLNNITVYARFTKIDYGVIFHYNDGETPNKTVTEPELEYGGKVQSETPERTGYTFDGWYTEEELENTYDFNTEVTTVINLYGKWIKNKYSLTIKPNGGIYKESTNDTVINDIEYEEEKTISNPTKEGYTFNGWTLTGNGSSLVGTTFKMGYENAVLEANWTPIEYQVKYNGNGNTSGEMSNSTHTYDIAKNLNKNTYEKIGYHFVGWSKTSTGEVEYIDEQSVINLSSEENSIVNLYAKWEADTHTLTIKPNGGIYNNTSSDTVINNVKTDEEIENIINPTKEGYTFNGWTLTGNGSSLVGTIFKMGYEDAVLEASWKINKHTLTIKPNGGIYNNTSSDTVLENKEYQEEIEILVPTRTGYTFKGWEQVPNNVYNSDENKVTMPDSDVTIKALWEENVYEITLESTLNENKGTEKLYEKYDVGIYFDRECENEYTNKIELPVKEGYTFKGYYKDELKYIENIGSKTSVFTNNAFTEDTTLYAEYQINGYTLKVNTNGGTYEDNLLDENNEIVLNYQEEYNVKEIEKTGYTFTGWTSEPDGIYNSETNKVVMPASDASISATFEINKYTVTYYDQDNNGNYVINPNYPSEEVNYHEKATRPETDPSSKEGYEFKRWALEENGNSAYDFDTLVEGNINLYAVYAEKEYQVLYIKDNEIVSRTNVKYNHVIPSTTAPEVEKEYHTFNGWKLKGNYYNFDRAVGLNDVENELVEGKETIKLVADFTGLPKPTISHTPTTWTNENVEVTVEGQEGYDIQYKKEGDSSYSDYIGSFEVGSNLNVYARLKKNNALGEEVDHEIKNIDKLSPSIEGEVQEESITKNSFNLNIESAEQEDSKGIYSGIKEIRILDENDNEKAKIENINAKTYENTVTIDNLEPETTYRFKVVVKDNAENENETEVIEVTTLSKIYVALVTYKEDESSITEENPGRFESVQEAIDYCELSKCTVKIIQKKDLENQIIDLEENGITVLEGQEVTLDLNGVTLKSSTTSTLTNTGKLVVTDTSEEETGKILSLNNNGIDNSGRLELGVNDGTVTSNLQIIGSIYGVNTTSNNFAFYDGIVKGYQAINGQVTEKAYPYNVKNTGSNPQVASLEVVSDPEAEVGGVYFGRLANATPSALDTANKGNYETEEKTENLMDSIKTLKDNYYTFVKQEDGSLINNNIYEADDRLKGTRAHAYIKLDLTDYENDQVLTINAQTENVLGSVGIAYASISQTKDMVYEYEVANRFLKIESEDKEAEDYSITLEKGQVYYLHIGYLNNYYNNTQGDGKFIINSITLRDDIENSESTSNIVYNESFPILNTQVDTIRLLKDITLDEPLEIEETRDTILDLKGHKLTTSDSDYVIKNNGSLKIIDSKYTSDIQDINATIEEQNAQYLAEYEEEKEEYLANKNDTQHQYNEEYQQNLQNKIEAASDRKNAQLEYETALQRYNSQMQQYELDLKSYKQYMSKFTMPNMDGIVDYFDYNNYENGVWSNTVSDGHEMTIYGTPENNDGGIRFNRTAGENYATLPYDNTGNGVIYSVFKANTVGNDRRFLTIPATGSDWHSWVSVHCINYDTLGYSTYGYDVDRETEKSASDYNVVAIAVDMTNNTMTLYVNGDKEGSIELSSVGNLLYLVNDLSSSSYYGDVTFKMLSVGNELQTEEEILENSSYLYDKYIDGLTLDDPRITNFRYTGNYQTFKAPVTGTYKIETWGAQGGGTSSTPGGKGAYASGTIELNKDETIYVYVGGTGKDDSSVTFNNGGITNTSKPGYSGGGATDIRLVAGEWDDFDSLKSRIMVAAGGGGSVTWFLEQSGGAGGALTGLDGTIYGSSGTIAKGGTQTEGGQDGQGVGNPTQGGFGKVSDGFSLLSDSPGFAGSGYYAGGHGANGDSTLGSGAGGSSFVSGYNGCDAIDESSTEDNIIHTGQSIHYSRKKFKTPEMLAGNENMPARNGIDTVTGNEGNGYAKITIVDYEGELPNSEEVVEMPTKPQKPTVVINGYSVNDYVSDNLVMHLDGIEHGDSNNLWNDLSENNNDGIMTNVTRTNDNGFLFNGSNSGLVSSNQINISRNATFEILLNKSTNGGMAIDARNSDYGGYQPLYFNGDTAEIFSGTGGQFNQSFSGNSDNIHSYVIMYSESGVKVYADGNYISESSVPKGFEFLSNIYLGRGYTNNYLFNGVIYNFKYYDRNLTEDEIKQNYEVDAARYGLSNITSNTSNGIITSSLESENAYKLFDSDVETTYSVLLNEEVVTWNMDEENTITSFKMYGSNDSSKYPTSIKIEGSKDGENYETLIYSNNLEAKGLNEYNLFEVEEENIDSYRYYKYTFTGENGIEINEIKLEKYDVSRQLYEDSFTQIQSLDNFNDNSKRPFSDGTITTTTEDGDISLRIEYKGIANMYYKNKINVEDYPITVTGNAYLLTDGGEGGYLYVGFATSNEPTTDDFIEYKSYYRPYYSDMTEDFSITVSDPGEYYFKVVAVTKRDNDHVRAKVSNVKISDVPIRKYANVDTPNLAGNITSTTADTIYNEENASLVIEDGIINVDKANATGITNYGTLQLGTNSVVNANASGTKGVLNVKDSTLRESNGTINVKNEASRGIIQRTVSAIDGLNINISGGETAFGILCDTPQDCVVEKAKIYGSGTAIYAINNTNVITNEDVNIYARMGIYSPVNNYASMEINGSTIYATVNSIYTNGSYCGYEPCPTGTVVINDIKASSESDWGFSFENSDVTINNGKLDSNDKGISTRNSNLTINKFDIETTGTSISSWNYDSWKHNLITKKLNIKHDSESAITITNSNTEINPGLNISENSKGDYGIKMDNNTSIVNINGPIGQNDEPIKIFGDHYYGIYDASDYNASDYLNITGKVDIIAREYGLMLNGNNNVNVSGEVTIKGKVAVSNYGSSIDAGTINIGRPINDKYDSTTNELVLEGDGVVDTEYPKLIGETVGVSNGNIMNFNFYDGSIKAKKVQVYDTDNTYKYKNFYFVDGKINEVEKDYEINLQTEQSGDDQYEIATLYIPASVANENNAVAKIGDNLYTTLESAIADLPANTEKTIKILKNIVTVVPIEIGENKKAIIDLDGHEIDYLYGSTFITNNGTLKLTGNFVYDTENADINRKIGERIYVCCADVFDNYNDLKIDSVRLFTSNYTKNFIRTFENSKSEIDKSYILRINQVIDENYYLINNESTYSETDSMMFKDSYIENGNLIVEKGSIKLDNVNFISSSTFNVEDEGTLNISKVKFKSGDLILNNNGVTNIKKLVTSNTTSGSDIYNKKENSVINIGYESDKVYDENSETDDELLLYSDVYNQSSGTINIANAKFENTYWGVALYNSSNGDINIYGGTKMGVDSSYRIENNSTGTVNFYNGMINSSYYYSPIINKGILNLGIKASTEELANSTEKVITNPVIKSTYYDYAISNNSEDAKINFYDGILESASENVIYGSFNELETGYSVKNGNDGSFYTKYLDKPVIATIGNEEFYSLESAISSTECESSCTIVMQNEPIIFDNTDTIEINASQNIIIELNGVSLNPSNQKFIENNGILKIVGTKSGSTYQESISTIKSQLFENNNTLIFDSVKINDNRNIDLYDTVTIENNGDLTITDSDFKSPRITIKNNGSGDTNIENSKITSGAAGVYNESTGTTIIKDSTLDQSRSSDQSQLASAVVNKKGTMIIDGGTYSSYTCGIYSCYDITIDNYSNMEIKNNPTLSPHGTAIVNNNDVTNQENTDPIINGRGKINIKSATVNSGTNAIVNNANKIENEKNIVIDNLTVKATNGNPAMDTGIINNTDGDIEIKDIDMYVEYNAILNESTANITILDGSIISTSNNAIENKSTGTITIGNPNTSYKSTPIIESSLQSAILNNAGGTVNWYDGQLVGKEDKSYFGKIDNITDNHEISTSYSNKIVNDYTRNIETKSLVTTKNVSVGINKYLTISEALNSLDCETSCEIKLLDNIDILNSEDTINIPANKNITINIDTYNLYSSGNTMFNVNAGGILTLKSSVSGNNKPYINSNIGNIVQNDGTLNISNIKFKTKLSSAIDNKSNMNIDNLEVYAEADQVYENIINNNVSNNEITVSISNSKFDMNGDYRGTVINNENGNINITNSELTGSAKNSNSIKNNGVITLSHSSITTGNIINQSEKTMNLTSVFTNKYELNEQTNKEEITKTVAIFNNGIITIKEENEGETKLGAIYNNGNLIFKSGTVEGAINDIVTNSGTMRIESGNIFATQAPDTYSEAILNNGRLDVIGPNVNITGRYYDITNNGCQLNETIVNIENVTFNSGNTAIKNYCARAVVNLKNVTIQGIENGIYSNASNDSQINIDKSVLIDVTDSAIKSDTSDNGIINIGYPIKPAIIDSYTDEDDNIIYDDGVSTEEPFIKGNNSGINNLSNTNKINFYDGQIIGATSISGRYNIEPGYRVKEEVYSSDTLLKKSTLEKSTVAIVIFETSGMTFDDLQAAINGSSDGVIEMRNDYSMSENVVIPSGKTINLNTNGHTLSKNGHTITVNGTLIIDGGNSISNQVLAAIRKFLNIEETKDVSKNIIIYEMNDGSSLESTKEYELEMKVRGNYEKIDVDEVLDNVGRYNISEKTSNTKMSTINGKIYINKLPNGEYRVVDNIGKEVSFVIDDEGHLSGNVKENYTNNISNIMSKSRAELIVNIQTGNLTTKYTILLTLIGIIISLLIVIKRRKALE